MRVKFAGVMWDVRLPTCALCGQNLPVPGSLIDLRCTMPTVKAVQKLDRSLRRFIEKPLTTTVFIAGKRRRVYLQEYRIDNGIGDSLQVTAGLAEIDAPTPHI